MGKKKRKRNPLKANTKRQAYASLRGYRYQIWCSVEAWLDLTEDETLYLEGAEDFEIVSDDTVTVVQVKDTRHNITLNSQEVIKAINNYWELWTSELQTNNSIRRIKFRFLTRSKIGKEQGNPFGKDQPGLRLWMRCSGDEETVKKISEFLQNQEKISDEVKNFLKQAESQQIYEQLIEPITWETNSEDASSIERSINDKVLLVGKQYFIPIPPHDTKEVVDSLLTKALTVATQKGNRELTQMHFLKIFYEKAMQNVLNWYPQHLRVVAERAAALDNANIAFMGGKSDVPIQSLSPIQTAIPPLYPNAFRRTDLLTSIHAKLQSDGIVIIHGGVDKGKTTLAKLTANDIDADWFWLKFTNKDASQVVQDLQQLDIAISNRSSQVNVVFDDLNLQPQELQGYEEDLSVVVYRVLERGAKLLITSQHKPPNNFIRSLGLSSPVVVHVPNFTISEIEQFARQLGCPAEKSKTWAKLFQFPTKRHPRLVHALLTQLRKDGWKRQDVIESILQTPPELVKELKEAQQLLTNLPEDQQEFLYRLSLICTEFRKDYALNISEIPEIISYPGRVFDQLIDPWMDRIDEAYYILSPLLDNAAEQVWPESEIDRFHTEVANAILKARNLTTIEARAIFLHSMRGQNREGLIAVIGSLMTAPEDDWENLCQEFSWLRSIKIDPYEEFFPGDAFVNYWFRSLQYRIAVEVEPKFAPKVLEVWDKETKPYKPRQSYLLSRLTLATRALRYNQVALPAKKLVGYLKEMIEIKNRDEKTWEKYLDSMGAVEAYITDKSNFFSFLFGFIYVRHDISVAFLSDLIDALDELDPKDRTLLLVDFEDDGVESRLLIDGVWWTEANLETPDWIKCLEVFDRVIEKSITWDYPHIAAASARGKAIICDEYLDDRGTAHKVLQEIISKVGPLPIIEEEQAFIYFHQECYKEALNIYERILPEWNPPSRELLDVIPLEAHRRAAMCAAHLGDWKKAATFFEDGVTRTQNIESPEKQIGLYVDAGFAYFKAGNMFNCIKLLHLALQNFEMLSQDNTDVKYYTLKKRLEHTIKWIRMKLLGSENNSSLPFEPSVGFCSDPESKKEYLDLPYSPIGISWLYLAEIEYIFGHGTTVFQHALQITDREEYPNLNFPISFLEAKYEFKNKIFDDLPQRIHQLAGVYSLMKKHQQSGRGAGEKGSYSISDSDLSDFASVDNIIAIFVAALVIEMQTNRNEQDILAKWRTNSFELPIQENVYSALDLIEPIWSGDYNNALTVMYTPDEKLEKQLAALIKVIHNQETSLEDLLFAHTIISSSFINSPWEDLVVKDLGVLLSIQWLQKIEFRAKLKTPMLTVPQIEKACKSNETGKKKIGQILLAVHQAVSVKVPLSSKFFQQFRAWTESESKQRQEPEKRKNPAAQRLIKAMEKPPHLTEADIEALNQSIKEGEIPIKFDSPFDSDEPEQ